MGGIFYVIYQVAPSEESSIQWTSRAFGCLLLIALILLFQQFYVGYTGAFPQHADFTARNAQYGTICMEAWPVFSPDGCPYVYYYSSYLPPALLSKFLGFSSRNYLLLASNWIFLCATYLLICYKCKRVTLLPLLGLLTIQQIPVIFSTGYDFLFGSCWVRDFVGLFGNRNLAPDLFNQSASATNHAYLTAMASILILFSYKNRSTYLFVGALSVLYSPLGSLAIFPIVVYQLLRGLRVNSIIALLKDATSYFSLFIFVVTVVFYTQSESSEGGFTWGLSHIPTENISMFLALWVLNMVFFFFIFYRAAQGSALFWLIFITFNCLPFVAFGTNYNELMLKASLVFYIYAATLYPCIWQKDAPLYAKLLALFCVFVFVGNLRRSVPRALQSYSLASNIKDPYSSNYYSKAALEARYSNSRGYREFGGMKDTPSRPLLPGILRLPEGAK